MQVVSLFVCGGGELNVDNDKEIQKQRMHEPHVFDTWLQDVPWHC